jgi:hypothetical protein
MLMVQLFGTNIGATVLLSRESLDDCWRLNATARMRLTAS